MPISAGRGEKRQVAGTQMVIQSFASPLLVLAIRPSPPWPAKHLSQGDRPIGGALAPRREEPACSLLMHVRSPLSWVGSLISTTPPQSHQHLLRACPPTQDDHPDKAANREVS